MSKRAAFATIVLVLVHVFAQRDARAQAYCSPLEFTLFPMSLEWPAYFAEDFEATSAASRMRLRGPVKSVTTHYLLAPNSDPSQETVPHHMSVALQFDEQGNLECSQFNDSRTQDHRESMFRVSYELQGGKPIVSHIAATTVYFADGGPMPEITPNEEVAKFTYDANGRIASFTNAQSYRFRNAHFERNADGSLASIRYKREEGDGTLYRFDSEGRVLMVPSRAAAEDQIDARWTGRDQFDWLYDGKPDGRRGWICFDECGTPVGWEFPGMGPWIRFQQSVTYDHHGNWTSLMVDVTVTRTDGTRIVGQPAWGFVRHIEYSR